MTSTNNAMQCDYSNLLELLEEDYDFNCSFEDVELEAKSKSPKIASVPDDMQSCSSIREPPDDTSPNIEVPETTSLVTVGHEVNEELPTSSSDKIDENFRASQEQQQDTSEKEQQNTKLNRPKTKTKTRLALQFLHERRERQKAKANRARMYRTMAIVQKTKAKHYSGPPSSEMIDISEDSPSEELDYVSKEVPLKRNENSDKSKHIDNVEVIDIDDDDLSNAYKSSSSLKSIEQSADSSFSWATQFINKELKQMQSQTTIDCSLRYVPSRNLLNIDLRQENSSHEDCFEQSTTLRREDQRSSNYRHREETTNGSARHLERLSGSSEKERKSHKLSGRRTRHNLDRMPSRNRSSRSISRRTSNSTSRQERPPRTSRSPLRHSSTKYRTRTPSWERLASKYQRHYERRLSRRRTSTREKSLEERIDPSESSGEIGICDSRSAVGSKSPILKNLNSSQQISSMVPLTRHRARGTAKPCAMIAPVSVEKRSRTRVPAPTVDHSGHDPALHMPHDVDISKFPELSTLLDDREIRRWWDIWLDEHRKDWLKKQENIRNQQLIKETQLQNAHALQLKKAKKIFFNDFATEFVRNANAGHPSSNPTDRS